MDVVHCHSVLRDGKFPVGYSRRADLFLAIPPPIMMMTVYDNDDDEGFIGPSLKLNSVH